MDIPETIFTNFHISDHLESFDSETDYIGLMISSVKYQDKWYHDGKQHNYLTHSIRKRRQKRYARKTKDTWRQWVRQKYITTTEAVSIERVYTNRFQTFTQYPNEIETISDSIPTPIPALHQTTPTPIYIPTRRSPSYRYTTKGTPKTSTTRSLIEKRVRVQPGTIVMMNSTHLKQKYISKGLAKTYHGALLMDYFGLSESDMNTMRMSVVAWGFSYQVRDRPPARPGFDRLTVLNTILKQITKSLFKSFLKLFLKVFQTLD